MVHPDEQQSAEAPPEPASPGVLLIPERFVVQLAGQDIELTPTEFRLLAVLAGKPGRAFTRAELVEHAIGTLVCDRTVDVHVRALRRKLGPHAERIETVRLLGYCFRGQSADSR